MSEHELNARQEAFCQQYIVDNNRTQAAIRAGYSPKTAKQQGSRLLTNAYVAARIAVLRKERAKRLLISQDEVALELQHMGMANVFDFLTFRGDGMPIVDLTQVTRDQAAGIVQLDMESTTVNEDGKASSTETTFKIRIGNKHQALRSLGEHLGMWPKNFAALGINAPGAGDKDTVIPLVIELAPAPFPEDHPKFDED